MRRHGSLKFFKSAASMGVMPVAATEYVRFRSPYPSSSGLKIGVFGLVNILGRRGMLTQAEERFRRENNDWYNAAYPEPDIYGPDINPLAECWFKACSCELVSRVSGYLAILDAHSIAWEEVRATDPGTILYEDRWQVVAVSATPPTGTLPR
jgi:hypothetical protein